MLLAATSQWRLVLDVVASCASIAGLWFSIWAWQRAKGAEEAARQARDAVHRGSAAEEVQRIAIKSKEMLVCVQAAQYTEARSKSADLLVEVSQAMTRWKDFLTEVGADKLERARGKVGTISRALSEIRGDPEPDAREKLLNACQDVAIRLAESTGSIMNNIRKESDDGGTS